MRDSTFQIFEDFAIDFWTDIPTNNGTLKTISNSGDGVHLNDEGHRILLERLIEKNIYEFLLGEKTTNIIDDKQSQIWEVFPNPTSHSLTVKGGDLTF